MPTLVLTDDDDGIVIVKSGAPHPGEEMLAWLERECRGACRPHCDGAFNVIFEFDDADDAARFAQRWSALPRSPPD
jgi:hypothetical protein